MSNLITFIKKVKYFIYYLLQPQIEIPSSFRLLSRRDSDFQKFIIREFTPSSQDLVDLKLWNTDMKDKLIYYNGSIQLIDEIPDKLKKLYKTAWEMKQKAIIDQAIERGPYVCQTQSMNLFFEEPTHKILTGAFFYGWSKGLKTGSYYIRTRPKVQAQQFTIDPEKFRKKVEENKNNGETKYEVCEMCSS